MKSWALDTVSEAIAEHFQDKEIDGRVLLSRTVCTDEAMDKLGLNMIGKKGKFLAQIEELSGRIIRVSRSVESFRVTNPCFAAYLLV